MLEHRTKLFGRSGKICGDTLQKSFLEWTYAKFEVKRLSQFARTCLQSKQVAGTSERQQKRYMKTVQRITEATEDLEKLTAELLCGRERKTIEGLYLSIKQRKFQLYRQSGGNKRRHKLRKKIVEEKKALEDAITEHMLLSGKRTNSLLLTSSWLRTTTPGNGNVMLSEGITGQSSTEALTERGHEGLLCVQKKQLHKESAA
ncbi:O-methyltransferase afvC, partial [Dissostichus eleginoides]